MPRNNKFDKADISTGLLIASFSLQHMDLIYIKYLIKNGANINAQDKNGDTILHVAIKRKNEAVIDYLLEQDLNASIKNNLGITAYDLARNIPNHSLAVKLKKKSSSFLDFRLLLAIQKSDLVAADQMLKLGAESNFYDHEGRTPLHIASIRSDSNMVKLLLRNGADPNLLDEEGISVLHYALHNHHSNSEELICNLLLHRADPNLNSDKDFSVVYKIVFRGYENALNLAIVKIPNVDFPRSIDNLTALHMAVKRESLLMLKLLLAQGADISIENSEGLTAYSMALQLNLREISKILNSKTTKFISAAANNDKKTVLKLISQKIDVNSKGYYQETALNLASKRCLPEMVNILLSNNASFTECPIGENALHFAARSRCYEVIDILVEHGADPNHSNLLGITPKHLLPEYTI